MTVRWPSLQIPPLNFLVNNQFSELSELFPLESSLESNLWSFEIAEKQVSTISECCVTKWRLCNMRMNYEDDDDDDE